MEVWCLRLREGRRQTPGLISFIVVFIITVSCIRKSLPICSRESCLQFFVVRVIMEYVELENKNILITINSSTLFL